MKEIKAIIQPHMLNRVMDALRVLPHFPGVTISDCQGQGRGRGPGGHFEATPDTIFFARKIQLEVFCDDHLAGELVSVIRQAAHTGNAGDGIIMVADLNRVVRIQDGAEQDQAV